MTGKLGTLTYTTAMSTLLAWLLRDDQDAHPDTIGNGSSGMSGAGLVRGTSIAGERSTSYGVSTGVIRRPLGRNRQSK